MRPAPVLIEVRLLELIVGHCMRPVGLFLLCGTALGSLVCGAQSADLPTQAPVPASGPSCFASLADYLLASEEECPLSWNGITLYGRIDVGAGYETHGVPFNGAYPNGVETLISKNSNGSRTTILPNGLGQSNVGVKGDEPIAPDWSLVFNFQTGFNPYYPQLANGPRSLVQNNLAALRDARHCAVSPQRRALSSADSGWDGR